MAGNKNPFEQGRHRQRGRPSLSKPRLPPIPGSPKHPKGYGLDDLKKAFQGLRGASTFKPTEPAGDPPQDWPGTRPEWAVYWALTYVLQMQNGIDFTYQARLRGVELAPYSTVDFLIHSLHIAIEVQGKFWHGSTQENDAMRAAQFATQGITVVPIDEDMALDNPVYYVQEALAGRSHSIISPGG